MIIEVNVKVLGAITHRERQYEIAKSSQERTKDGTNVKNKRHTVSLSRREL